MSGAPFIPAPLFSRRKTDHTDRQKSSGISLNDHEVAYLKEASGRYVIYLVAI